MNFEYSRKVQQLRQRLLEFMDEFVYPHESTFQEQLRNAATRWSSPPIIEELKQKARQQQLWNLFLPESEYGAGLTNLEYAPLCEIMGRSPIAPEVFNCAAPDTGNMEVLVRYGTAEQKAEWLVPLLDGRNPFLLCHDGAGGCFVRCHEHSGSDRASRIELRDQWSQVVDFRRCTSTLQDRHSHGKD